MNYKSLVRILQTNSSGTPTPTSRNGIWEIAPLLISIAHNQNKPNMNVHEIHWQKHKQSFVVFTLKKTWALKVSTDWLYTVCVFIGDHRKAITFHGASMYFSIRARNFHVVQPHTHKRIRLLIFHEHFAFIRGWNRPQVSTAEWYGHHNSI